MSIYEKHVFVCENERPDDHPRGCCSAKGSMEILRRLKEETEKAGLRPRVRINAAGCLSLCENGPMVVVYPEGVWYARVSPEDVDEIVRDHLAGGKPVERLRLKFPGRS